MNETILIIEDDNEVIRNLETLLEEENYEVVTAPNGKEGVNLANEILPDLILCDIVMPEMTGLEVLSKLSLNNKTEIIPFIFLTAKTDLHDIRVGMNLGADDYLLKPYKSIELLKAIDTRLKKVIKIKSSQINESADKVESKSKFNVNESISINVNGTPQFIKINSIVYIEADRQYVNIVLEDGKRVMVRKSLTYWHDKLPDNVFLRIHRSIIVNSDFVIRVERWFKNSYKVHLKSEFGSLSMSRRYAAKFKKQE